MKKVIRFLIISLAPIVVMIAYLICYSWASTYANKYYVMLPLMITNVFEYVFIGIALLLISKTTLERKETTRISLEFLLGILLLVFSNLYFILPEFPFPQIFAFVVGLGMPITGLFIGVYSVLFIILLCRRRKALKARKAEQNNQLSV